MDANLKIAGLLRDLASVQSSRHSKWGYKHAASAVMNLPVPIESMRNPDGTFQKIAHVGPSSTRVIREFLDTGASETVDQAVAASGKAAEIEGRRHWQLQFLSRAKVLAANDPGSADKDTVSLQDLRADFQMHSTWSDGSDSLEELADGCLARGYTHCVMTDHSHGLRIARGLSMDDLRRQHAEIDTVNERYAPTFRIIKGIEANIRADGSLDMSTDELDALEFVVAAPHAVLRSLEDQTERMIAVVNHPHVRVLGHPRGRMFGSRPGVSADWPRVFGVAAERGVAIEIDGDPSRQDVDFTLAGVALAAGCVFALSSDAHAASQLRYIETAVAHARLARVPRERVINTWALGRLLDWAGAR
jgi:histidinol phosphatase-like PHP family hydrolase